MGSELISPGMSGYDNALFVWDAGSPVRRVLEGRGRDYFQQPGW